MKTFFNLLLITILLFFVLDAQSATFNLPVYQSYTTVERDALPYAKKGMILFNTDSGLLEVYNGAVWANMSGASFMTELGDVTGAMAPVTTDLLFFDPGTSKWNNLTGGLQGVFNITPNAITPATLGSDITLAVSSTEASSLGQFNIVGDNLDLGTHARFAVFDGATLQLKVSPDLLYLKATEIQLDGTLEFAADNTVKIAKYETDMILVTPADTSLPTTLSVDKYHKANLAIKVWTASTPYLTSDIVRSGLKTYTPKVGFTSNAVIFTIANWDPIDEEDIQQAYDLDLDHKLLLEKDITNGGLHLEAKAGQLSSTESVFKVSGSTASSIFKITEDRTFLNSLETQTNKLMFVVDQATKIDKFDTIVPGTPLDTSVPTSKAMADWVDVEKTKVYNYNDVATTYKQDQSVIQDGTLYTLIGPGDLVTSGIGFNDTLWRKVGGAGGAPDFEALKVYKQNDMIFHDVSLRRSKIDFTSGASYLATDWEVVSRAKPFREIQASTYYEAGDSVFITEIRYIFDSNFTTSASLNVALEVDIPWAQIHAANTGTMNVSGSKVVDSHVAPSNITTSSVIKDFASSATSGKKYFIRGSAYHSNIASGDQSIIEYTNGGTTQRLSMFLDSGGTGNNFRVSGFTSQTFTYNGGALTLDATITNTGSISAGDRTWFELHEVSEIEGTILTGKQARNDFSIIVDPSTVLVEDATVTTDSGTDTVVDSLGEYANATDRYQLNVLIKKSLFSSAPNLKSVMYQGSVSSDDMLDSMRVPTLDTGSVWGYRVKWFRVGGGSHSPNNVKMFFEKTDTDYKDLQDIVVILPKIKQTATEYLTGEEAPNGKPIWAYNISWAGTSSATFVIDTLATNLEMQNSVYYSGAARTFLGVIVADGTNNIGLYYQKSNGNVTLQNTGLLIQEVSYILRYTKP